MSAEFKAFGQTYPSEREAIIGLIDALQAEESAAGVVLANWAKVCQDPALKGGLTMIAEREAYHGRVFARRMQALGVPCKASINPCRGPEYQAFMADPAVSDAAKLARAYDNIGNVETLIQPVIEFAASIKEDPETREALRLYCEDEISSGRWLCEACGRLGVDRSSAPVTANAA